MKNKTMGLILSIEKGRATLLTADGQFVKQSVPEGQFFVGDEIPLHGDKESVFNSLVNKSRALIQRPVLQVALSLVLIITAGTVSWAYPAGHVYMDVNPSLGLSYNVYHRVIGMESFNEDGEIVIKQVSFYGKTIPEGVAETLKVMDSEGFIKDGVNEISGVLIGYTDPKVEKALITSVNAISEKVNKPVQVATVKVNAYATQLANEDKDTKEGVSPIQIAISVNKVPSPETSTNNKSDAQKALKAKIKAEAKALKQKTTSEIIDGNQALVKTVPNEKVDKIKTRIKDQKKVTPKEMPKVELKVTPKETPKADPKAKEVKSNNENQTEETKNENQTVKPKDEKKEIKEKEVNPKEVKTKEEKKEVKPKSETKEVKPKGETKEVKPKQEIKTKEVKEKKNKK